MDICKSLCLCSNDKFLILLLYVDDMLIMGQDTDMV